MAHNAHTIFVEFANADAKALPEATQAINKFKERMQRVRDLVLIKKQTDERVALAADGITIPDDLFSLAYERHPTDENLRAARTHLHGQVVNKLTADTEPIAKRIARAVIAGIGADLDEAEKIERRIRDRYHFGCELANLRASLDGIVAEMRRIVEKGHDLSLHTRPCHAVAAWFSTPIALGEDLYR